MLRGRSYENAKSQGVQNNEGKKETPKRRIKVINWAKKPRTGIDIHEQIRHKNESEPE